MHDKTSAGPDRSAVGVSRARRYTTWLLVLIGTGTAYLLLNLAQMPFGRDQAIFAMVAATFFEGGQPYSDAWDFKTPGIFLLYVAARVLFGPSELGFRLFEILWWMSMGAAFLAIGRGRIDPRGGIIAFALAVYGMLVAGFWHVGQPESFGAGLIALALALYMAPPHGRWLRFAAWTAAAALYTAAALLKPPLGGGVLVSAGIVGVITWRREGPRAFASAVLAHLLGGFVVLAAVVAWLLLSGAWPAFREALFVFAPNYAALGHSSASFVSLVLRACLGLAAGWPWIPAGLLLLFTFGWRDRRLMEAAGHILGVAAMTILGVALQAKFFPYHYAATVALLSLPAGWGVWCLWQRIAGRPLAVVAFALVLGVLALLPPNGVQGWKHNLLRTTALLVPSRREEIEDKIYLAGMDWASNRKAAAWLAAHAPEVGDPSLFVWGFEPSLYYYSGLRPHNRYIYNIPLRTPWSEEAARAEFLELYAAAPPWAIVVQSNDRLPWVTGDARSSRSILQDGFPELRHALDQDYTLRETIGPLAIHVSTVAR